MVRFEAQNQPLPAKGSYMYDQTYTSFWDAVLQERPGSNDRSFEKNDMKQEEAVNVKMTISEAAVRAPTMQQEIKEEKKCADEDSILAADDDKGNTAVDSPTTATTAGSEGDEEEPDDYAQMSPSQYEAPALPAEGEGEGEGEEEREATPKEVTDEQGPLATTEEEVALEYKAEDNDSQQNEAPLTPEVKPPGKPEPEVSSPLMTEVVSDAAKKEPESQQQEQKEEEENAEDDVTLIEGSELPPLLQGAPLNVDSLAEAQAQLMEQAKSLAKAQALIQAQAKALARMEQQQQQLQHKASPSTSPARTDKPKSPLRASPYHPKPRSVRAPSDAPSDEFFMNTSKYESAPAPLTSAASLAASLAMPDEKEPVGSTSKQRPSSELSQSANSDTTVVTSNTNTLSTTTPNRDEIITVLDGEWLSQAKSEAQAKAQALIRTAQAEAAARAQARKEAKERHLAEEKARLKAEAEAQIKAKAVRDAWQFEQTQAAFRAEEKARAKAKAAAKAAAEEKMQRKADMDAATHNVLDAQRAQIKAEAEYKLRRKAEMDARFLAECKARRMAEARARKEAMEKAKAAEEERAAAAMLEADRQQKIREMGAAQARANAEHHRRLKEEAMEKERRRKQEVMQMAKAEHERQAALAKKEAEREEILKEMAAAQARANAEHKLRLKAEMDARWLAECKARRAAEAKAREQKIAAEAKAREQAMAEAKAEAKVRAKMAKAGELPPPNSPARDQGILSSLPGAQSWAAARKLLLESPKEFVPFGKSKGEEEEDRIILFLQVPGVVHVSEVKVELEDGVLYISRGIILDGVEGVQKYTRSFPFEEQLLDTYRISVALIPANATADSVSVLRFTLPKVRSTWKIPMYLASEKDNEADADKADTKDVKEASLDAPDDEVSLVHPSDEMEPTKTAVDGPGDELGEGGAMEDATTPRRTSHMFEDKKGFRVLSLQVSTNLQLRDISAIYSQDTVRVVGNDGPRLAFRHVVPMNSHEVEVRELEGSYDLESGLLILKGPLKSDPSVSKPRSRRIKVVKMEESQDGTGFISLFNDDVSVSSKGSTQSNANQYSPDHKKKGISSIKSIASKYLRLKPKKHKHETP